MSTSPDNLMPATERLHRLAVKLAEAVERDYGGLQPWGNTQRAMLTNTIFVALIEHNAGRIFP